MGLMTLLMPDRVDDLDVVAARLMRDEQKFVTRSSSLFSELSRIGPRDVAVIKAHFPCVPSREMRQIQ